MSPESVFLFTQADVEELEQLQREEPERLIRIVDFHYVPLSLGAVLSSSGYIFVTILGAVFL